MTTAPAPTAPSTGADTFDAVVVGARCAGASLAIDLARGGWRVAMVDKAHFPSDTLSTHVIFPDGIARLDRLGALALLGRRHDLAPARYSWRVLGHEVAGAFTPVDGHDRALSVRRVSLDAVLVELAVEAGATLLSGRRVTGILGAGTGDDPVHGVVLDDGRELRAPWVLGADGQRSSVAHHLGVERVEERRGELALLLGYWRGLPASDWIRLDMHDVSALMAAPCEDGLHLLTVAGPPDLTRGTPAERRGPLPPGAARLPGGAQPAVARGRRAGLPGRRRAGDDDARLLPRSPPAWVGPSSATPGTSSTPPPARASATRSPRPSSSPATARRRRPVGLRAVAGRAVHGGLRVLLPRRPGPEPVPRPVRRTGRGPGRRTAVPRHLHAPDPAVRRLHPERSRRWRAAAAYEDGLRRLVALVDGLPDRDLGTPVPACPLWSVRDLVAHLTGIAEDAPHGSFYEGAVGAWADPALAAEREAWTAAQVEPAATST